MNSMQLKDKLRNISNKQKVDFNSLLRLYMYDRFIERLSFSKYKDNFILKGGFYLSTLFGLENRTTMDIDTAFKDAIFNEETIIQMMKEITSVKIDDNTKITYLGIAPIRDEDEYGGFRVNIQVELDNIKEIFHIDIATGDPITPKEIVYRYLPLLEDRYINLWAYNIETLLAEKLETIFSRVELNGRMRDFYDVYLIYIKNWENINKAYYRKAVDKTFSKREYNGNLLETLDVIKNSKLLKKRWNIYQKKYEYSKNVDFDEVLSCIDTMINELYIVV